MYQRIPHFLLLISLSILGGCGAGQSLTFEPVAKLGQAKYNKDKYFYRSGVLERLDQPKGFFWNLKIKC